MNRRGLIRVAVAPFLGITMMAGNSMAQSNGEQPSSSKNGTRVITLGTRGGPSPTVGRTQSSNLLVVNGFEYIIDSGDGVTRRLTQIGNNFRVIENIFITHAHSDHISGLGALMSIMYDTNRTKPVKIWGAPGTAASVQGLLQFVTVSSEIRMSDGTRVVPATKIFSGHDIGVGTAFQDANVKVTAVENSHFHFPAGSPGFGKYKSYSYRFDTADRSVVFTGDTGPSDAVADLAKGADILFTEVSSVEDFKEQSIKTGRWQLMTPAQQADSIRHQIEEHVTPEEIGKMATRAGVKTVVLTHLPATGNANDDYQRLVDQVKKQFTGQVLVAKDKMEF